MNKVVIIGRPTKDWELKYTPGNGTAVATSTIAVDKKKKEDGADFIPVVVWGKTAEFVANNSAKGKLISIAGRIQTRSYDAKDGTKRYVTEVVAEEVKILEWANSNQGSMDEVYKHFNDKGIETGFGDEMTPVDDGDIPF